jgi:lipid-A-disaccharide synthase
MTDTKPELAVASSGPGKLLISAAEASGDRIGANLMAALAAVEGRTPGFVGAGGPAMAEAGLNSLYDTRGLAVMGLRDVVPAIPRVLSFAGKLADLAEREGVDAAILIDSWGFHYQVAKRLRQRLPALPIIRYVAPQVWASRPHRAAGLKAFADLVLTLFPFEPELFTAHGLDAAFVGHPVFDRPPEPPETGRAFRERHGVPAEAPLLCVLPGSRANEVRALLPVFTDTLKGLHRDGAVPYVATITPPHLRGQVDAFVREWPVTPIFAEGEADKRAMFAASDLALAASGTVVLELARQNTPSLVTYKVGGMTYQWVLDQLITKFAAVPNYVAAREVVPEYIQGLCQARILAPAVHRLLTNPALRADMRKALAEQMARLAPPAGSVPGEAAAHAILTFLQSRAGQADAAGADLTLSDRTAP